MYFYQFTNFERNFGSKLLLSQDCLHNFYKIWLLGIRRSVGKLLSFGQKCIPYFFIIFLFFKLLKIYSARKIVKIGFLHVVDSMHFYKLQSINGIKVKCSQFDQKMYDNSKHVLTFRTIKSDMIKNYLSIKEYLLIFSKLQILYI